MVGETKHVALGCLLGALTQNQHEQEGKEARQTENDTELLPTLNGLSQRLQCFCDRGRLILEKELVHVR